MLDRTRPELIQRDTFRSLAFDPSRVPPPPVVRPSFITRHLQIPIASVALIVVIVALEPAGMVAPEAPAVIDVVGAVFGWGMLAMVFSFLIARPLAAVGGLVAGTSGLVLWLWCGLGGHAPMTAPWYAATGVATVAYVALNARVLAKAARP